MTTTITRGPTSTVPTLVLGYETHVSKPMRLHPIIGRSDPDVTIGTATSRDGTLSLFYVTEAEAGTAVDLLLLPGPFTLTDDEHPRIGMTFVIGDLRLREDSDHWIIDATYQEVYP